MNLDAIREMIETYPERDKLPCAVAHYIASRLGIEPLEVGRAANALGRTLTFCQLGLFGYGRKGKSAYKIMGRPVELEGDVVMRIKAKATEQKAIACRDLWEIADASGVIRCEVGNAADALGLKITPCQLGAFPKEKKTSHS